MGLQAAHIAAANGMISVLDYLLKQVLSMVFMDLNLDKVPSFSTLIQKGEQESFEINSIDCLGRTPLEVS